jgi:NAD(P)-dependent dehydrogenase (short-subunit alcohol dehydrogenase family)
VKASTQSVVVTGTATGIGHATAVYLADRGYRVFAAVRKPADVRGWEQDHPDRIVPLVLDVTRPETIDHARATVSECIGDEPLHGLVNNAGVTLTCPMEFVDLDAMRHQFEVNVFGVAAVTSAFLPLMKRPGGRIVNVSSGAGKIAPPLIGPYSASKHALEAMSDALRLELRGQGIHVSIIEPGFIESQMHTKNEEATRLLLDELPEEGRQRYGEAIERMRANDHRLAANAAPAIVVSEAIHNALSSSRPRTRYPVTREAKLLALIGGLLTDRMRDGIFGRITGL